MKIKAITFDLWDTVFIDNSDEIKRKKAGRLSKPKERRQIIFNALKGKATKETVNAVYDALDAAYKKVWKELHVTWSVTARLKLIFQGLGVMPEQTVFNEIVKQHEEMELEFRPDFISGVHEAIKQLSKEYKLGVISDAIVSPGRCLRKMLEDEGLIQYISAFVFSDEQAHSKPHPSVFLEACRQLDVKPEQLVHIGDREENDIKGAHNIGAYSILCAAAVNRNSGKTEADQVFTDYSKLPELIKQL